MWKTIVLKDPTVGRSEDRSIEFFVVLNTKLALVRFCLSKPPKINMLVDEI